MRIIASLCINSQVWVKLRNSSHQTARLNETWDRDVAAVAHVLAVARLSSRQTHMSRALERKRLHHHQWAGLIPLEGSCRRDGRGDGNSTSRTVSPRTWLYIYFKGTWNRKVQLLSQLMCLCASKYCSGRKHIPEEDTKKAHLQTILGNIINDGLN